MVSIRTHLVTIWLSLFVTAATSFVLPKNQIQHPFVRDSLISTRSSSTTLLFAKKKKKSTKGKGFGKVTDAPTVDTTTKSDTANLSSEPVAAAMTDATGGLQSLSDGDISNAAVPTIDESVPVEERTSSILRGYGLRTMEEQQEELKRQEKVREEKEKLEEWKKMADRGEDFDIMAILPDPVLVFIDKFLKFGVATCTVLFVLAGLAITVEAWSKASDSPLPENIDAFITNTVEPNFTPGLLVLLGFSVSLGVFAAAQLGSSSSTYREDR